MNFNEKEIKELDKTLTPEEQSEWDNIYSSFRSQSIITGIVNGIDSFQINDKIMLAAVIIDFRVKILIPENDLWEFKMQKGVTRNLLGAKISFVVTDIDRENNCAVASRVEALKRRQRKFISRNIKTGAIVKSNVLVVGKRKLTIECHGYDVALEQKDLSYAVIQDLRDEYHAGQELDVIVLQSPSEGGELQISHRDTMPHPYNGLKERHPVHSRRYTEISAKYRGAVFCRIEKDFDCLCQISSDYVYDDFRVGDKVVIVIKKYNDNTKRIYGKIVSKWS